MHVHTLTCTYKLQNCIYENWVDFKKNVHFFMEIYIFIYKNIICIIAICLINIYINKCVSVH